jgi:hypothetical protein
MRITDQSANPRAQYSRIVRAHLGPLPRAYNEYTSQQTTCDVRAKTSPCKTQSTLRLAKISRAASAEQQQKRNRFERDGLRFRSRSTATNRSLHSELPAPR